MEAKTNQFELNLQAAAASAKLLGHPARITILEFLGSQESCMTGSISDHIPLARTTVNQHLSALKEAGWVKGTISGAKSNYCLDHEKIKGETEEILQFLKTLQTKQSNC